MEKKIRVTLPKNIVKILESDYETFKITKNYLLNYIFENMRDEILNEDITFEGEKEIIQFNLNKKNYKDYYDFLCEKNIQVEAYFFRKLIYKYFEAILSK